MLTNFFPISLPFEKFQVRRVNHQDGLLDELRRENNSTHSFFRDGDYIYISPDTDRPLEIGKTVELDVEANERVVSSLIKHIFFRAFRKSYPHIVPLEFYPFTFLSTLDRDDLAKASLPDDLKGQLGFRKAIEVYFRRIQIQGKQTFGATISVYHKWIFSKNCASLLGEGFELLNREVVHSHPLPGLTGVLAPDESLIGVLVDVNHSIGHVETNDGLTKWKMDELFLHKSASNIKEYLAFKIGAPRAEAIFEQIHRTDVDRFNAKGFFEDISSISKTFSKLDLRNTDNFCFELSHSSLLPDNAFRIEEPTFIFDHSGTKTNRLSDLGLNSFGPFDSLNFDIKRPKVMVICHKKNRGGYSTFLAKLQHGIGQSKYFKKGLVAKYLLHGIDFVIEDIDDYSVESYKTCIDKVLRSNTGARFDLAIVETKQEFKALNPVDNPYYQAKAQLLSLQIPVQFLISEKVRQADAVLDSLLNSVALQVYAKMGGTPWVIPANQNIDREIIIGLASSWLRKNRFAKAEQSRVVGITTFFSADGKYDFGRKCRDVPYGEYFDELLQSLRTSIEELSRRDGWRDGDTVRIVVHIFKPIKNVEADVVVKLVGEFAAYRIRFCFVTISERHPFLLFDPNQKGIDRYGNTKGEFLPTRGQSLILDSHSCLLQMKGPKDVKTPRQGLSKPLLVRIHPSSTFTDLNYVCQQIYTLTYLSWRSFLPSKTPVTVLYSSLIADQLQNLREVQGWNPEVVNTELKHKKWFL